MTLLKIKIFFALTALPLASLGAINKPTTLDTEGIAKYVYPENRPETPPKMVYAPDGESYLVLASDGKNVTRHNTVTGAEMEKVIDVTHTRENSISSIADFEISPDGSKLLLYTTKTPIYRRSFKADYYVFEIKRNILRPLSKEHPAQQSPLFSPDGRMVAFAADGNLFLKKLDYDTEMPVTTDGETGKIINGTCDWTYEEEFNVTRSMAWAPDNSTLSYLKYDESRVPLYHFSIYDGYCEPKPEYALYPGVFSYKYPVAGEPNSMVTLHSYDVDTRKTKDVPLTDAKIEYIPKIAYGGYDPERLMVVTLNRDQNRMEVYAVNPKSTVSRSVLVEEAKEGWLAPEAYEGMVFEEDGFVVMSERTGWRHLYRYAYNGTLTATLTSGNYDVTAYYGKDTQGISYFQSTGTTGEVNDALNRVVSRIIPKGKGSVTEAISQAQGTSSAVFSPMLNYYTLQHNSATEVPVYTLRNSKGKVLRTVQDNAATAATYSSVPKREFFTFTTDGGTVLNGYLVKPDNFNPSGRYPIIMWQYSGPGSQEVLNKWAIDWQMYAALNGLVVVCVDGRGTGNRGAAFRNCVYKNLGDLETVDQLAAARWAASQSWADPQRIGICGWSFGGYETLMAVTDPASAFSAAVAIAPVTSWRYYDTAYTERFMLTPNQNSEGYEASAPVNRAANMNTQLLIMHGTSDDNVHLANTMEFVDRLQQNGRYADMFLFPAKNHSIFGCGARALVYARMIKFFQDNL